MRSPLAVRESAVCSSSSGRSVLSLRSCRFERIVSASPVLLISLTALSSPPLLPACAPFTRSLPRLLVFFASSLSASFLLSLHPLASVHSPLRSCLNQANLASVQPVPHLQNLDRNPHRHPCPLSLLRARCLGGLPASFALFSRMTALRHSCLSIPVCVRMCDLICITSSAPRILAHHLFLDSSLASSTPQLAHSSVLTLLSITSAAPMLLPIQLDSPPSRSLSALQWSVTCCLLFDAVSLRCAIYSCASALQRDSDSRLSAVCFRDPLQIRSCCLHSVVSSQLTCPRPDSQPRRICSATLTPPPLQR